MAGEHPEFVFWVKLQPCCVPDCRHRGCRQAHHAGTDRGLSRKAHDDTCIPLCPIHHTDWHQASGYFAGMDRERRRAWASAQIARTQSAWRAAQARLTRKCGFCREPGHDRRTCPKVKRLQLIRELVARRRQ